MDGIEKPKKLGEILVGKDKKELYSIDNKILIETKNDYSDSNRLINVGEYNLDKKDIKFNKNLNKYAKKYDIDEKKLTNSIITIYFTKKINYN